LSRVAVDGRFALVDSINGEKVSITTGGNVGIGTTAPGQKLEVVGNVLVKNTLTNASFYLAQEADNSSTFYQYNNGTLKNALFSNGNSFITGGNVGIGTSTPNARLDVGYAGGGVSLRIEREPNSRLDFYQGGGISYIDSSPAGAQLAFSTVGSERMRITSGGFTKMSTDGTYLDSASYHELRTDNSGNITTVFTNKSTDPYGIYVGFPSANPDNTTNYFLRCASSGGVTRLFIYSNGNVVNTNNSYGGISDIKLKENISDSTPKLADLLKVKIKNFNFIGSENKQLGVIAQELEEIFPSMIDTSPDKDELGNDLGTVTKSVKYSVFVPMLIKAVQELSDKITTLENK